MVRWCAACKKWRVRIRFQFFFTKRTELNKCASITPDFHCQIVLARARAASISRAASPNPLLPTSISTLLDPANLVSHAGNSPCAGANRSSPAASRPPRSRKRRGTQRCARCSLRATRGSRTRPDSAPHRTCGPSRMSGTYWTRCTRCRCCGKLSQTQRLGASAAGFFAAEASATHHVHPVDRAARGQVRERGRAGGHRARHVVEEKRPNRRF